MADNFTCDACGGTFEKGRSDEEAKAEMHSIFGKVIRDEECAIICEDCFKRLDPANNPHMVEQAVRDTLRARDGT